ncbi:hypothetical protein MJ3_11175 [Salimicrobium jeotgali]|uniref:Uncharacterized protein n=1 Tax=Salimicrobium jeotgali TaxID=1230341 RepID=K2G6T0_9BACI|nr:hypothetical protein MJ3_11175 [Salimicrobium jeotgali]
MPNKELLDVGVFLKGDQRVDIGGRGFIERGDVANSDVSVAIFLKNTASDVELVFAFHFSRYLCCFVS